MAVHITLALLPLDGFQHTRTYMASTSAEGQRDSRNKTDLAMLAFHLGGEPAGATSFSTAMEQIVGVVIADDPLQAWLQLPQHCRIGSLELGSAGMLVWHIIVSRTYDAKVEKANKRKADSQPGSKQSKQQDRTIESTILSLMWPAYHGQLQTSAHTAVSRNGVTPIAQKLLLFLAAGVAIALKLSIGASVPTFEEQIRRLHETKRNANNNVARPQTSRATKEKRRAANTVNSSQVLLEIDLLVKALKNSKGFKLPENVVEVLPRGSIVPYVEVFNAVLPFWNAKLCMTSYSDRAEREEEARNAMNASLAHIDTGAIHERMKQLAMGTSPIPSS
ncbi:hypothetical protein V8C86DRAFT_2913890 [Haematococcus lacustris]